MGIGIQKETERQKYTNGQVVKRFHDREVFGVVGGLSIARGITAVIGEVGGKGHHMGIYRLFRSPQSRKHRTQ